MKIIETTFLRGPNVHSSRPCFVAVLDLEALDEISSADIDGFTDRLCEQLPTLQVHRCSTGYRGGFVDRLKEGTYMAHITEHVLLELQCLAGTEVGFGKARMIPNRPRHYTIACSYKIEHLVARALPVAIALVVATAKAEPFDLTARLKELRELVKIYGIGPSSQAIIDAAQARNIPVMRLTEESSLFQLGWGKAQQRIQATVTSKTSLIAAEVASDKQLTKRLLAEAKLPVPEGGVVSLAADAAALAQQLGGVVTIKPLNGNQGRGVSSVSANDDIQAACKYAQQYGNQIVVEETIRGDDFRVLIVGNQVIAAAKRTPPTLTGDGTQTIRALIDLENQNPIRGEGHEKTQTYIPIDAHTEHVLARQGFTLDSILPSAQCIAIRDNANLSTGGIAEDVTDQLHPGIRQACIRAAHKCGLDIAGIDLICSDITQPLENQRGALIEVNASPGIRMHEHPAIGKPRAAGRAIISHLFADGETGRIPIIAVTGTNGKTTTTLLIARAFHDLGLTTGVTTTEGVFIQDRLVSTGDCTGYWSARTVLTSPEVDIAVLETARGGILRRGLAFDRCDVSVVLNVGADHIGQDGIDDLDALARVKAVVAHCASKAVILNAEDPYCVAMVDHDVREGVEVIFFSLSPHAPVLQAHLKRGGRAVYLDNETVVIAHGKQLVPVLATRRMPFTLAGRARHNVANALAAIAALVAIGCPPKQWVTALTSFRSDAQQNPLRMNLYDINGVTALVDYAHNPAAYQAIIDTCRSYSQGRIIGVISAPGDRRDQELRDVGAICSAGFDELIIYELVDDLRGRPPGEGAHILLEGARSIQPRHTPSVVIAVQAAVRAALQRCRPGDMLVLGCASETTDLTEAIENLRISPLAA